MLFLRPTQQIQDLSMYSSVGFQRASVVLGAEFAVVIKDNIL
jgi:hypothetical protein